MTHGLNTLQHWNQWLSQDFLGMDLLQREQEELTKLLKKHLGKQALLVGVPHQYDLLKEISIPCHTLMSPLLLRQEHYSYIEGDFHELPILTGSIDLVVLPHTLEFVDNPRQLLVETCRIVKPEGLIAICGFNPYSMWGLRKILAKHKNAPWSGNFIHSTKLKGWLRLADFALEQEQSILFRPPLQQRKLYEKLFFFEKIGKVFFPFFGGLYILLARAKVIPLTPIRMKWKQQLNGIRISTTISTPTAR